MLNQKDSYRFVQVETDLRKAEALIKDAIKELNECENQQAHEKALSLIESFKTLNNCRYEIRKIQ